MIKNSVLKCAFAALFASTFAQSAAAPTSWSSYFDLGPHLIQEFHGTYEFKYKRVEYTKSNDGYTVKSSGDQSPETDRIVLRGNSVKWILGGPGDEWISLEGDIRAGAHWSHALRNWRQTYTVTAVNETVVVPAGSFSHCATIEITWTAHEHDLEGPQKVVLYLAPSLGIIKREEWSDGEKWHEEALDKFSR